MASVQGFEEPRNAATASRGHLVAHRGWPARFPENTLAGFSAAIAAGAQILECDVQLTLDRIPVVFHDDTLDRTTNAHGPLFEQCARDLGKVRIKPPNRGKPGSGTHSIATLAQLMEHLAGHPSVRVLVELKSASAGYFGRSAMLGAVLEDCARYAAQITLIAHDAELLALARDRAGHSIGWIAHDAGDASRALACALCPDVLLISTRHLATETPPWPSDAAWMVYTVNDPEIASARISAGFDYVETDDIGNLLEAVQ